MRIVVGGRGRRWFFGVFFLSGAKEVVQSTEWLKRAEFDARTRVQVVDAWCSR